MINLLKRIVLPTMLLFSSLAHAKEIQQQDFLHDFYNTTILHIGMDNGCGTFDLDKYSFIVRGAADYLMDEQDWALDQAKSFLKAGALQLHQTANAYIKLNGCDRFNFLVIEKRYDYKIIDDVLEIYSFEKPVDFIQLKYYI